MSSLFKTTNIENISNNNKNGFKLDDKKEFRIVRDTLVKYGMPTKNFDSNLPGLFVNEDYNKSPMYGKNEYIAGSYLAKTNTINLPEKSEDYIHELFHMASNNFSDRNSLMGCEIRNGENIFGESLNDGITDYFTSLAVDGYISRYPVESFFASYISKIYGIDIFKEHFNGDANTFYSSFGEDEKIIRKITERLDIFYNIIKSYKDLFETNFFNESQDSDFASNYDYFKKNGNKVSDCFIDSVCEFVRLIQLKNLDEKEFVGDLVKMLNNKDSKFIKFVTTLFVISSYKKTDNVIKEINEEIEEDRFGL